MKILRIETEDGVGIHTHKGHYLCRYPYELDLNRSHYLSDGTERKQHPDTEPFWLKTTKEHYYGFASKEDLDIWVSPVDLGWYEVNGFYIYVYEVDDEYVLKGKRQLAFIRSKSQRLGKYKRNFKLK